MPRRGRRRRAAVFVAVVALVVAATAAAGLAVDRGPVPDPSDPPEYEHDGPLLEPLPASGRVTVSGAPVGGVVVVDRAHANRYDRADLTELVAALVELGVEVRFHDEGPLEDALVDADGYVVIDPATPFDDGEVDTVERFVDDGGRLLLLGEPERSRIEAVTLFGTNLAPVESELHALANRFGFTIGSDYLYNLENNDGNHRNVVVEPGDDASTLDAMDDVERGVVYTATYVDALGGDSVLVGSAGTARSVTDDDDRTFTVAVVDGDVMAVGDSSFLAGETFNVADNEEVIAALVEFLLGGERQNPGAPLDGEDDDRDDADADDEGEGDGDGETDVEDGNESDGEGNVDDGPPGDGADTTDDSDGEENGGDGSSDGDGESVQEAGAARLTDRLDRSG